MWLAFLPSLRGGCSAALITRIPGGVKFDEEKRDERIHFFRLLTFTAGILFFEGKGGRAGGGYYTEEGWERKYLVGERRDGRWILHWRFEFIKTVIYIKPEIT